MSRDQIQAEVDQLKAETEQSAFLTDEQRQSLNELTQRLELMMSGELDHPEQDLLDKLEQQVFVYEETHPLLARIFDNVVTLLHGMGI